MNQKRLIISIGAAALLLTVSFTSVVSMNSIKESKPNTQYSNVLFEETPTFSSNGNTLYVGGEGPGNYTSIQAAINDALDGDTVFVYNDMSPYNENIVVDKAINVIGEHKYTTIIDGGGGGDVIYVSSSWVNISGFTIQNCGSGAWPYYDAGIDLRSDHNTLNGNIIRNNNRHGIYLDGSHYNNILGNTVVDNQLRGIRLQGSDFNTITGNDVENSSSGEVNAGITLGSDSNNNNVTGNNVSKCIYGINTKMAFNNIISSNTLFNNTKRGIKIDTSTNITITDNTIESKSIRVVGNSLEHWNTHTIENNMANGKPIYYYKNIDGGFVPSDAIQVILGNCSNFTIENLDISEANGGIQLGFSSYNTIRNNTIDTAIPQDNVYTGGIYFFRSSRNSIYQNDISNNTGNGIHIEVQSNYNNIYSNTIRDNGANGIYLAGAFNNTVVENDIFYNNEDAICLGNADYNSFEGNTIMHSSENGLDLHDSTNNVVVDNNISYNNRGITFDTESDDNTIPGNIISYCDIGINTGYADRNVIIRNTLMNNHVGIRSRETGGDNRFYYNNFLGNTQNAEDRGVNFWDNGYPFGGNYWDDYSGVDVSPQDGLGDTPYNIINGSNQDQYPLMQPYSQLVMNRNTGELFPTIQEAVDDSDTVDGHYIFACAKTYYENIDISKGISLIGEDKTTTVIDGGGNNFGIDVSADGAYITEFNIQNSDIGIEINSDSNTIEGNTITNNNDEGIVLASSTSLNTITDNMITENNNGIKLAVDTFTNTIVGNDVVGNINRGIFGNGCSGGTISNNIIEGNTNEGILLSGSSNVDIFENEITLNKHGISLASSYSVNISENDILLNEEDGVRFSSSHDNFVISNNVEDNLYGLFLVGSSEKNEISSNFITGNNYYGVCIMSSNDNLIFNNYFDNNANAYDDSTNIWNISYDASPGPNIIGDPHMGGNFWPDYTGLDDGSGSWPHNISYDGIGDTDLPYDVEGSIQSGGDYLPLIYQQPTFIRGDVEADGDVDMADAIHLLRALYVTGWIGCFDAADVNDDGGDSPTMGDAIYILRWLYIPGWPDPPAPGPYTCGPDPTEDNLDCGCFEPCGWCQ